MQREEARNDCAEHEQQDDDRRRKAEEQLARLEVVQSKLREVRVARPLARYVSLEALVVGGLHDVDETLGRVLRVSARRHQQRR